MSFLHLKNAAIGYKRGELVVENLELNIVEGELVSFLGPSGCGKTTTLRAIAGFVELQKGKLLIADKDYSNVPANKRNIGMVFQSYALFPHLNVFENVAFGLRLRKVDKQDLKVRVDDALAMVGLMGFDARLPSQLSGGQQQRVAMARAIVIEPQLLLLDEPLSNLDAKLRIELRAELKRVQRRLGVTMIYVTHDQEEALALSDRVVVMNAGKIEQIGSPEEIYQTPSTLFVANFMGVSNQFKGIAKARENGFVKVALADGLELSAKAANNVQAGEGVTVAFRPSAVSLSDTVSQADFFLPAEVVLRTFQGDTVNYLLKTSLGDIKAELAATTPHKEQDQVFLMLSPEVCTAYSA